MVSGAIEIPAQPVPSTETIVLAAGADERYALGLTVALTSALRHLDRRRRAHVFVLDGGLTERSRQRCLAGLARVRPDAEVTVVRDDPSRFSEYHYHQYSRAAYLRLLIPEIVPDAYPRVLYLDSDLVVADDVAELWSLPLAGHAFWAALDDGLNGTGYVREALAFAKIPASSPYFNSGVMLIELPQWKAAHVSERAQTILAAHSGQCGAADQDALNIVAVGEWGTLPAKWNFQVRGRQPVAKRVAGAAPLPAIIHFLDHKPWSPGVRCLHQDAFDSALRESGWYTPLALHRHFWRRRAQEGVQRLIAATRRRLRSRSGQGATRPMR